MPYECGWFPTKWAPFYSLTESSFQGIPAEKNVLEDISKGFLTHPSNVKGHGGALPRRPSVLGCCELAVSHREQHSSLFFAKIGFCFLLVMETGQIIYNDREPGPFEEDSCHGQECSGEAPVQGTPLKLLNAHGRRSQAALW